MPDHPFKNSYVICTRRLRKERFEAEPGSARYLRVPDGRDPLPGDGISRAVWFREVRDRADGAADNRIDPAGDVLVFIHGYNSDQRLVMRRHRRLQADLWVEGFRGLVVSFDWPSASSTLNYLEDRWDAARTAIELVTACAKPLADGQRSGCATNVHLLGHSTGAYVIREAFYHARTKGVLHRGDWKVSQIAFVGADISSASLAEGNAVSAAMFTRSLRVTNYSNRFDKVLKVSNAKRLGTSPRAGRVGVPTDAHSSVVDVDCSDFFDRLDPKAQQFFGTFCHSWHIGNPIFARDLACVLHGGIDRHAIPTRRLEAGALVLRDTPRPKQEGRWLDDSAEVARAD